MSDASSSTLTRKDFVSDQEVRWCPGCGDYAILAALQRSFAQVGVVPENTVIVSGIGCSSRLPYYMNTYGFHTIHGRAPAVATGLKIARPDLEVWVVTGDGDGLSIGGNHLLHALRRNVDLHIVLFNNQIYGLTKGQYSPTSKRGKVSPSTPMGSLDEPVSPARFALGAGTHFFARGYDVSKRLPELLMRARAHHGSSFVEVLQNCLVFNNGAFGDLKDPDGQVWVEHGKPIVFGRNNERGLRLNPAALSLEVVDVGAEGVSIDELVVHDERNRTLAWLLASLEAPFVFGVLYCANGGTYDDAVREQVHQAQHGTTTAADIDAFLRQGPVWEVR